MVDIPKNPVAPTILLLAASATVGGLIALAIGFVSAMGAVVLSGPFGWLTLGPAVIAAFSSAITWLIIGVPVWAIIGGAIFARWSSGSTGSAVSALGIVLLPEESALHQRTNELARKAGLDSIKWVGWCPSDDINAMAIGDTIDNAMICISKGAIDRLTKRDVDAILAHEVAHVASQDMQRMTQARGVQEALTWFLGFRKLKKFARWVFTPLSELYVLKFSREREFAADAIAGQLTSPEDIRSALVAIHFDQLSGLSPDQYVAVQINGRAKSDVWSTHPGTLKRIQSLTISNEKSTHD